MIIGSISENKDLEKRISITPEIAKKYINLGFEVQLSKDYGKHFRIYGWIFSKSKSSDETKGSSHTISSKRK